MASVGSVTRQIAALEISDKKASSSSSNPTARFLHTKQPSQVSVSKLLTKFAAPNPFPSATNKPTQPSSLRYLTQTIKPVNIGVQQAPVDIGRYDGGLEIDNEKRGEEVHGEAAEELALNSSASRYVGFFLNS